MADLTLNTIINTAKQNISLLFHGINHLLWPAVCSICGVSISESSKGLCNDCWQGIMKCTGGDYCPGCGKDVSKYALIGSKCAACQQKKIYYDSIARGGVYEAPLRDMILALKFRDRTELTDYLCQLADSALTGSVFYDDIDFFIPVPLHWLRRLYRGFNQSAVICKGLKHKTAPVSIDLIRTRYTARQWKLSPAKRKKNVKGAFSVRKGHIFSGRNVCLVDDITTSGATLNECAKTLKEAGANKVYALIVSVAMQDWE